MKEFLKKIISMMKDTFQNRKRLLWLRCVLSISAILILCSLRWYVLSNDEAYYLGALLPSVLLMLVVALYGLYNGVICFLFVFLFSLFVSPQDAYMDFFYLSEVLYVSAAMRMGFFSKKRNLVKNLLLAVLILGNIAIITYDMVALESFSGFKLIHIIRDMSLAIPQVAGMILIIFFVSQKIPAKYREFFPGLYDSCLNVEILKKINERKNKKLSSKISALITGEAAILGIAAAVYANMLIPTLGSNVLSRRGSGQEMFSSQIQTEEKNENEADGENKTDGENEADGGNETDEGNVIAKELPGEQILQFFDVNFDEYLQSYGDFKMDDSARENVLNFVFNDMGKSFDLKMIMLLINTAFPMVVLSNAFAQLMIANPVSQMSEALARYTGNFENREESAKELKELKINTKDEIELLYASILKMDEKLGEYLEQVRKDQELKEELRVAQATSAAKSSFLSNMSHEIRTPINAVLGMDEMILRETEEENIVKYATDIKNSGKTLLSLVNDILDFSKIEAGKMDIIPVEYELSSVINDLINMISIKAEDKGLRLDVDVNRQIPHLLYGDEIRLKQCVTNILSNAVKYTPEGSVTLRVDFERSDTDSIDLKFQVIDTGIGIKEEDLKKLFSPFERIEEKRNRTIEGTGLGMNIVKQLLALMDSELVVKSVYGKGSDFSFRVKQRIVKDEPIGDFNETYKKSIKSSGRYVESFHAPGARILVVDDTKMNLTVIRGLLKPLKLQVETAESGRETLKLVQEKDYDVIFLDHRMPEMDGLETRAAMQELPGNRNQGVPVIALTANVISGAREVYLNAGFDDYLSKPIDSVKLEKLLMHYLPKEKLILPGEEGFEDTDSKNGETSEKNKKSDEKLTDNDAEITEETEKAADGMLRRLEGIDYGKAIANCVNEEILYEAIRDFYVSLDTVPDLIRTYAQEKNFKEYTVKVHALKSSARLIGAEELSGKAEYLEKCGNEENLSEIEEKTPELLALFESYREKLAVLFKTTEDQTTKEPIDPKALRQAFEGIRELVEAFDFDSAEEIVKMLEEYQIPEKELDRYDIIKKGIINVDRDEILEQLKEL